MLLSSALIINSLLLIVPEGIEINSFDETDLQSVAFNRTRRNWNPTTQSWLSAWLILLIVPEGIEIVLPGRPGRPGASF